MEIINSRISEENTQDINKFYIGCRWLSIGRNVSHNHCNYPYERSEWDYKEQLVNGRITSGLIWCNTKNIPDRFQ